MNAIYDGVINSVNKLLEQTKVYAKKYAEEDKDYYENVEIYLKMLLSCIDEEKAKMSLNEFYRNYMPKMPERIIDERPYYMPKMPEYITDERPPWVPPFKITCGSSATDKYIDYITGRNTSDCYVSNQTVEGYKDMPRPKPHGDSEKPPFQPRSDVCSLRSNTKAQ